MNRSLWLRFTGASIFFAVILSIGYLFLIRHFTSRPGDEVQHSMYLFIARIVEEGDYAEGLRRVQSYRSESPAIPIDLWIVDDENHILARSTTAEPPAALLARKKPLVIHTVAARGRFFSGVAASAIVRLQASEPRYLLIRNPGNPGRGALLTMAALFVATLAVAILLGLLLLTMYLRGRSAQARQVIKNMEAGDLAARFNSGRLDIIGGLMQNFNSMADEIQRLVTQLQATELQRRQLLQELGHDLRTPLTSLRAAIDTLATHGEAMMQQEREEFFNVVTSELDYFTRLLDDLFFIANIDDPRYRSQSGSLDLIAVLRQEVSQAQASPRAKGKKIGLDIQIDNGTGEEGRIPGDAYLISRLLRNALENAATHANSKVAVTVKGAVKTLDVIVADDGAGMSADAIASFGQRRNIRLPLHGSRSDSSLGLGSVIIKTIMELHGSQWKVDNGGADSLFPGLHLHLTFPRDLPKPEAL